VAVQVTVVVPLLLQAFAWNRFGLVVLRRRAMIVSLN
jgi:hypothetical protein